MANYEKEIKDLLQVPRYLGIQIDYEKNPEAVKWLNIGLFHYQQYFLKNKEPAFPIEPNVKDYDSFRKKVAGWQIVEIINYYRKLGNLPEEVYREVPIDFSGEPPLVSQGQASTEIFFRNVTVKAFIEYVPQKITLDITQLKEIGDALRVSNLQVPNRVTILTDPKAVIVQLNPYTKEVEAEAVPEEKIEEEKEEEEIKGPLPREEVTTIPVRLNEWMDELEKKRLSEIEADKTHTVAKAVKSAREHWAKKNRLQTILKNRSKFEEENDERFFVDNVEPKSGRERVILRDIETAARQAVIYQAATLEIGATDPIITKAIDDLVELGITGSFDFTNFNDLNALSLLVFKFEGKEITPAVNNVDEAVLAWQHAKEIEPYSDEPERLERVINQADEAARDNLKKTTAKLITDLTLENPDFPDNLEKAQSRITFIQDQLSKAIPNPVSPFPQKATPLELHGKELEQALRIADPTLLRMNPEGMGARTAALVEITKSQTENISSQAIALFSSGLTAKKLDDTLEKAGPDSKLAQILLKDGKHTDVYFQVHKQLRRLSESNLGKDITKGLTPLTGIGETITRTYNGLPPAAQTATKLILDPKGTVYAWANRQIGRQIGRRLIQNTGQLSQKLGNFLFEGLQQGVNKFAAATAEKLALGVAKKIGVTIVGDSLVATVAAAASIPTAGASLLIYAVLIVGQAAADFIFGKIKRQLDDIWRQLGWGEEFRFRDLAAPLVFAGGAAVATGATALTGFTFVIRTAPVAIASAAGVIVASIIALGTYLAFTYITAPMLSTLVQLDSVEKVKYEAAPITEITPGCPSAWPVKGSYAIKQGPGGKYSHSVPGYDQSVDMSAPMGTPVFSTSDGVVSFAGIMHDYLNTNVVIVETKLPNGTPFQVVYAHLSMMKVGKGQAVNVGSLIGASGTAGTGPHLHYEYKKIRYNQCPAGGIQLAENCSNSWPQPGKKCGTATYIYTNSGGGSIPGRPGR